MISPHKTPVLAKMAMLLLFAIGTVAVLDTNTISAQELGRTITSPFGIARQTSTSESGSDGDTFVDPETGEVGHIIRNPFGQANPEGVDTGIDIPDDAGEEVGGIITNPFGVPASDDIDTGVDVFDEDDEYLISLPEDEESEVDKHESMEDEGNADNALNDAKELVEEDSSKATIEENYIPVKDNPIPNREWDFSFTLTATTQSNGNSVIVTEDVPDDEIDTLFVRAGDSFRVSVTPTQGNSFSPGDPLWYVVDKYNQDPYGWNNVPSGKKKNTFVFPDDIEFEPGEYLITVSTGHGYNLGVPFVQRRIKIKIVLFSFVVDNPILPEEDSYNTLLATNIGDESECGHKPDYANWGPRKNESSLKKMTLSIDLGDNIQNEFVIKMLYKGKSSLNETIPTIPSNRLKDIFLRRANYVYKNYTVLKENSDRENYLRVWTSSKFREDGSCSYPITCTSARDYRVFGTIDTANYLAPDNNYSISDLFYNNSGTRDLYLEGINPHFSPLYVKAVLLHRNTNNGQFELVTNQIIKVKTIEAKTVLNTDNDPEYLLDDNDHMIKDQHKGFQGWYYSNDDNANTTYGIENIFPLEVVSLSQKPRGMKYVVEIEGEQNNGVVIYNPVLGPDEIGYLKYSRYITDVTNQLNNANTNNKKDLPDLNANQAVDCLFGVYYDDNIGPMETIESHISLYLCREDATTTNGGLLLDNARITIRPIEKYFELWSTKENLASFPENKEEYIYPIDHSPGVSGNEFKTYKDAVHDSFCANPSERNCEKNNLIALHGFHVQYILGDRSCQAFDFHRTLFRKLYWSGYRDNYIGWCWVGNDKNCEGDGTGTLIEMNPNSSWDATNFSPNVYHAMQSSRSLCKFIQDLPNTNQYSINMAAHSLGNLVMWDAIRLNGCGSNPKRIENVISIEGAVWSEAFRDCTPLVYANELFPSSDITYPVDSLEKHSWAHWFRQPEHSALSCVGKFINSRNIYDAPLHVMKAWNRNRHSNYLDYYQRSSLNPRAPIVNGLPDLPMYPALLKKGHRTPNGLESPQGVPYYVPEDLTDPIGMSILNPQTNPDFDFHPNTSELNGNTSNGNASNGNASNLIDVNALEFGWKHVGGWDIGHNSLDERFDEIQNWYYTVFQEESGIIPNH